MAINMKNGTEQEVVGAWEPVGLQDDFDAWYKKKYLSTFEDDYQQPNMQIEPAMKALSRLTREYVSEMITLAIRTKL